MHHRCLWQACPHHTALLCSSESYISDQSSQCSSHAVVQVAAFPTKHYQALFQHETARRKHLAAALKDQQHPVPTSDHMVSCVMSAVWRSSRERSVTSLVWHVASRVISQVEDVLSPLGLLPGTCLHLKGLALGICGRVVPLAPTPHPPACHSVHMSRCATVHNHRGHTGT